MWRLYSGSLCKYRVVFIINILDSYFVGISLLTVCQCCWLTDCCMSGEERLEFSLSVFCESRACALFQSPIRGNGRGFKGQAFPLATRPERKARGIFRALYVSALTVITKHKVQDGFPVIWLSTFPSLKSGNQTPCLSLLYNLCSRWRIIESLQGYMWNQTADFSYCK